MVRHYKKNSWLFIVLAIALTGLGYAIDTDPAYPKLSTTLIEFTILASIVFIVLSLCYVGYRFIGEKLYGSK